MATYHRLGEVPGKRHMQFRAPNGQLCYEEVYGSEGFSGIYSILYHRRPPLHGARAMERQDVAPRALEGADHRLRYLRTDRLQPGGDPIRGRVPILFNAEVQISLARSLEPQPHLYRNGTADELLFVHEGLGTLQTNLGEIDFGPGDYLYVPRGVIQQLRLEDDQGSLLVIEAQGAIDTPERYRNQHRQLLEHAPFWERDFRKPARLPEPSASAGPHCLEVKIGQELHAYELAEHPFDVVGWDGYLYPYAFNIRDFEPHAGRFHIPPTAQQTFQGPGFVVCSFVPRKLDWDEQAVPVPYYHANIDSDEVLYYVSGRYGARRTEPGSMTFHPRGLTHGPAAGAVEASLTAPRETDDVAVMVDTFRPLTLAVACAEVHEASYPRANHR